MPEIIDLPSIEPNDVTDDDLLVVYDMGAASNPARKVTRGTLFKDVARTGTGADASFATVEAEDVQAQTATINTLSVATGLEMGATLARILTASGLVNIPTVEAGAQVTVSLPCSGVLVGDAVTAHLPATLPVTLVVRAAVSTPDVVTLYVLNVGAAAVAGADYLTRVVALRVTAA